MNQREKRLMLSAAQVAIRLFAEHLRRTNDQLRQQGYGLFADRMDEAVARAEAAMLAELTPKPESTPEEIAHGL